MAVGTGLKGVGEAGPGGERKDVTADSTGVTRDFETSIVPSKGGIMEERGKEFLPSSPAQSLDLTLLSGTFLRVRNSEQVKLSLNSRFQSAPVGQIWFCSAAVRPIQLVILQCRDWIVEAKGKIKLRTIWIKHKSIANNCKSQSWWGTSLLLAKPTYH